MSCTLLYVFDMFHILLPGDSLRDLWNIYILRSADPKYLNRVPQLLAPEILLDFRLSQRSS